MYLALSWRNIWRNKKRTIIVAASVFFAVFFSAFMRSSQLGSYDYMIYSSARLFTGYLQIQDKEYWEKRSLDNSFVTSEDELKKFRSIQNVTNLSPRLEAFALISSDTITRVSQVIGIHPDYEDAMTELSMRLQEGNFLKQSSSGILIGSSMAKKLGIGVGDTVSLYGSGYHGTTAAALLQVEGIVKLPFKTMDNGMVFFALPMAQDVFSCNGRITSLSVMVKSITGLEEVRETIESSLGDDRVVMSWDEMMPDLKQSIEVDNVGGIISLAVLYIVIAFGIFGTIMMMVSERTREFAVLISVGMQKFKLLIITAIEAIMVSFIGVIAGIITSIPVILYFVHNPIYLGAEYADLYEQYGIEPILNFSSDPMVFISQALVVLVIALATIIYPVLFIRKMNIAKTIRG